MYGLRLRHETMEPICLREAGKLGVSSWRLPEEGHYGGGYNSEQREASAALLRAPRFDEARPNSHKGRYVSCSGACLRLSGARVPCPLQ